MVLREDYDYPLPVQRPSSHGDKFIYIDYVNNEPFYVGMGNWVRVRNPDRNDYHVQMMFNLHCKDRWVRRVVARNLVKSDAFNLEHTLILCYGRKDIGSGILVNRNNGIGIDLRNVSAPRLSASKPLPKAVSCLAIFFLVIAASVLFLGRMIYSLAPARDMAVSPSIYPGTSPEVSTSSPLPVPTATPFKPSISRLRVGTKIRSGCLPGEKIIDGVITSVHENTYFVHWDGFQREIQYTDNELKQNFESGEFKRLQRFHFW